MNPAELKQLIEPFGIRPIHGRGQNFLLDESVVAAMVQAAGIGPSDAVVEIGPGPGILTAALLNRGAEVVAIEIDRKLCALLRHRFTGPAFHLLEGDALSFSNAELLRSFAGRDGGGDYRVVANLPYAITSPVLEKFLFHEPRPSRLTLMLQREVTDRILAGRGEMSSLAVMVQTLGRPKKVLDISRHVFFPSPKVDSSVIHIDLKSRTELDGFFGALPRERYFTVVRRAFSQKRKQLKNSLMEIAGSRQVLENALIKAKIDPRSRPEDLLPADWAELVSALQP